MPARTVKTDPSAPPQWAVLVAQISLQIDAVEATINTLTRLRTEANATGGPAEVQAALHDAINYETKKRKAMIRAVKALGADWPEPTK